MKRTRTALALTCLAALLIWLSGPATAQDLWVETYPPQPNPNGDAPVLSAPLVEMVDGGTRIAFTASECTGSIWQLSLGQGFEYRWGFGADLSRDDECYLQHQIYVGDVDFATLERFAFDTMTVRFGAFDADGNERTSSVQVTPADLTPQFTEPQPAPAAPVAPAPAPNPPPAGPAPTQPPAGPAPTGPPQSQPSASLPPPPTAPAPVAPAPAPAAPGPTTTAPGGQPAPTSSTSAPVTTAVPTTVDPDLAAGGENPFGQPPPTVAGSPNARPGPTPWTPAYEPPEGEFRYNQENFDDWLNRCRNENPDQLSSPPWFTFGFGTPQLEPARECDIERRSSRTAISEFTGGGNVSYGRGGIATGNYDIGADPGAWNHWDRKVLALATNTLFTWSSSVTSWTIRILEWTLDFPIAEALDDEAGAIATEFHAGLNEDATPGEGNWRSAYNLALFVTMAAAALKLLRGHTGAATSEFLVTYAVYALFVGVVATGGMTSIVSDTLTAASGTGGAVSAVVIADSNPSASCPEGTELGTSAYSIDGLNPILCPVAGELHQAFVERPYDYINWGGDLEGTACAETRDAILFSGPWGNDDQPRYMMGATDESCETFADYNHEPSVGRLTLAFIQLVVTWVVLFGILGLSISLALVQFILLAYVAVTPFAVLAGMFPGSARLLMWKWATGLFKVFFLVVGFAFGLSAYLVTYQALLAATSTMAWGVQGMALITVTIGAFLGIKRLRSASNALADRTAESLTKLTRTPTTGLVASAAAGWSNPDPGYAMRAGQAAGRAAETGLKAYALWQLGPFGAGLATRPDQPPAPKLPPRPGQPPAPTNPGNGPPGPVIRPQIGGGTPPSLPPTSPPPALPGGTPPDPPAPPDPAPRTPPPKDPKPDTPGPVPNSTEDELDRASGARWLDDVIDVDEVPARA